MHRHRYFFEPPRFWGINPRWFGPQAHYSFNEEENLYKFRIPLAGTAKEDIRIKASPTHLKVGVIKKLKDDKERLVYKHRYDFAKQIDPEGIIADYKDGLLILEVPLSKQAEFFDVKLVDESSKA